MKLHNSKVVIVGAGVVGSTTAYCLIVRGICSEVVIIDVNYEKALGEVLDLKHSIEYLERNVSVKAGTYEECRDADVVVITAAAPRNGETNRLNMMKDTAVIIRNVTEQVMAHGFDGCFVVISNPVDIMSYYVHKISGLPKNQVIGTGTALETARLKQIIGDVMKIDPKSVQAYAMGEHGDSLMVPWSHVRAGGKSFCDILEDNKERFANVNLDNLVEQTRLAGQEVLTRKNSTQYGIASAATAIIAAILRNENKMIVVSTYLEGEYGLSDVFCGVPAILNIEGVKEIGEFRLTEQESVRLKESAAIIQSYTKQLHLL